MSAKGGSRRVLIMVDCLRPGGAEGQVVLLCQLLRARGWEPRIACFEKVGWHLSRLSAMGVDPFELPLRGSLMRPNSAVQLGRLVGYLRREGIALIHAHDLYTNFFAAAAARLAGIPAVVSRLDLAHWYSGPRRTLQQWVQRHADAVFTNAGAITSLLVREEGLERSRIVQIPNGIDLERFDAEAALPPEPPVAGLGEESVIVLANMQHPVKGHRDLLFAAAEVVRQRPRATFVLAGDGGYRRDYEGLAERLGLAGRIVFAGRRPDAPRLLSRAAVAVSSSLAEGLSNSVIEAMAARLPLVATDAGGNVELVHAGRTGYLVPVGNPALMAARILDLLGDPGARRSLGAAGRRFVERHLNGEAMGEAFDRLYTHLIARSQLDGPVRERQGTLPEPPPLGEVRVPWPREEPATPLAAAAEA